MPFLLQQHPSPEDGSLTLPSPADLLLLLVPSPPTHQRRIVSWFFSHTLEHSVFVKIQWKKKETTHFTDCRTQALSLPLHHHHPNPGCASHYPDPSWKIWKLPVGRETEFKITLILSTCSIVQHQTKRQFFPKWQPLHATTSKFNEKTPSTQTKINTSSSSTSSSRFLRWCLRRDSFRCSAAAAATATPTSSSSSSSSASRSWYCCCFVTNAVAFFSACWYACRDSRHNS